MARGVRSASARHRRHALNGPAVNNGLERTITTDDCSGPAPPPITFDSVNQQHFARELGHQTSRSRWSIGASLWKSTPKYSRPGKSFTCAGTKRISALAKHAVRRWPSSIASLAWAFPRLSRVGQSSKIALGCRPTAQRNGREDPQRVSPRPMAEHRPFVED